MNGWLRVSSCTQPESTPRSSAQAYGLQPYDTEKPIRAVTIPIKHAQKQQECCRRYPYLGFLFRCYPDSSDNGNAQPRSKKRGSVNIPGSSSPLFLGGITSQVAL
jgi:hypothetical protein